MTRLNDETGRPGTPDAPTHADTELSDEDLEHVVGGLARALVYERAEATPARLGTSAPGMAPV
jgi:hypothetical protein